MDQIWLMFGPSTKNFLNIMGCKNKTNKQTKRRIYNRDHTWPYNSCYLAPHRKKFPNAWYKSISQSITPPKNAAVPLCHQTLSPSAAPSNCWVIFFLLDQCLQKHHTNLMLKCVTCWFCLLFLSAKHLRIMHVIACISNSHS